MTDSPFVINVTAPDFVKVVLEESHRRPVLVDFWASWCAPCRALAPILDKLAQEFGGKFLVAKIDTDQEKNLAIQLGIRSLPTVRLFRNGAVVDEFMGALPEADLRNFLHKHLPKPADGLLQQAEKFLAQGQIKQATDLLAQAHSTDSKDLRILLLQAKIKITLGEYDAAEQILNTLPLSEHGNVEAKILRAQLSFVRVVAQAPDKATLEGRLAASPEDSEARYQLAAHYVVAAVYQEALDNLLILLRKDRSYGDDAARKGMIGIFDILGNSGDLVNQYRIKLTNTLF
jgi:putative thioredoxin